MKKFISTKRFSGFTCCFRQWRAKHTHCSFLHGYAISFKVYFEGDLDENNWVWDFGGMKRAKNKIDGMRPDEWIKYMFDHTVIIAEDDPFLQEFIKMNENKIIQLRIIPYVGAEGFAEYIYNKLSKFIELETNNRVNIKKIEFSENKNNSAIYLNKK